jgi:AcrR family transcriptional regulator
LADVPGVKGQVQARGVERRKAIVDAAIAHFAREGYRGTGIAAIAEAAGVTTGGLLHHFGSKEGLLVEVLRERDRQAVRAFADAGATVAEYFDRWVDVATWNEDRVDLAMLYTVLHAEALDPEHPAHDYMQERNEQVLALMRGALQRGIDTGELRGDIDVKRKADEIVSFIEGAHVMWMYGQKKRGLTRLVRAYLDDQLLLLRAA